MRSSTNREDPNEMPPTAAFHQGLHFLLKKKKRSSDKNNVTSD